MPYITSTHQSATLRTRGPPALELQVITGLLRSASAGRPDYIERAARVRLLNTSFSNPPQSESDDIRRATNLGKDKDSSNETDMGML